MRLLILASIFYTISMTSALASAGLVCEIDDGNLKLDVEAGYSRSGGHVLLGVMGELTIRSDKAPKGQRPLAIKTENISQHWIDEKDLRLQINETEGNSPHSSAEISIMTRQLPDLEGNYEGDYQLKIFYAGHEPIRLSGKVKCTAG